MHTPSGVSRLGAGVGVVVALLGALLLGVTAPALAGVALSVSPDLQITVRHGQTGLAGRLTITNANSFPNDGNTDVISNVSLTPSCGDKTSAPTCGIADPGVFTIATPALGRTGTACGGITFDAVVINAGTGQLSITPQPPAPATFTVGPATAALAVRQCIIDFTFSVTSNNAEPVTDSDSTRSGKQTTAHAGAGALDPTTAETGAGVGTSDISFPLLTTATNPASGTVGVTTLQDQAALVGTTITLFPVPANTATGTITFSLFDPTSPNCTGGPRHAEDINLTACSSSTTGAGFSGCSTVTGFIPDQAGTWHWVATYSGDTVPSGPNAGAVRNVSVSSLCADEPVVIAPASPQLQTTPNPTTASVGGVALNDSAQLTGGSGLFTGTITFNLFDPDQAGCTGAPRFAQPVAVSAGGSAATSGGFIADKAGTWQWTASYSGDANNSAISSACGAEPVTISRVTPTLGTTPNPAAGSVGTTLNDAAQLTGGFSPFTGTITFNLFDPTQTNCTGTPRFTQAVAVSAGGSAATAGGPVADQAGTWQWTASYSGDVNNNPTSSACGAEPVTITSGGLSISTTPRPATGVLGTVLNDAATLTGSVSVAGTITFRLFGPTDPNCSRTPAFTQVVAVTSTGTVSTSGHFAANVPGVWHWTAVYNGTNGPVSSVCSAEPVSITGAIPTLSEWGMLLLVLLLVGIGLLTLPRRTNLTAA